MWMSHVLRLLCDKFRRYMYLKIIRNVSKNKFRFQFVLATLKHFKRKLNNIVDRTSA